MRVIVDWGPIADTARADTAGTLMPHRVAVSDSIVVRVEPLRDTSRCHPSRVVVAPSRLGDSLLLALVPRSWHIEIGSFSGQDVAIDPALALRRAPGGGSFGRLHAQRVVGWNSAAFPVPIVLSRARGVTSADSAAFWTNVRQVEGALGSTFFRPAADTEFADHIYPPVVRVDARLSSEGETFVSYDSTGEIFEGSIVFRRASDLSDPAIVAHELLHLLGFGHTNAWPSTLSPDATHPLGVTASDAAYAQLLLGLRRLQVERGAMGGLASTLALTNH